MQLTSKITKQVLTRPFNNQNSFYSTMTKVAQQQIEFYETFGEQKIKPSDNV